MTMCAFALNTPLRRPSICVVEDDAEQQQVLVTCLQQHGFGVIIASSAEEMLRDGKHRQADLLLMDAGFPQMTGLAACQALRAEGSAVGIILLSRQGEAVDRVIGLEMGADDVVAKPFVPREVCARVKAVLRRATRVQHTEPEACVMVGHGRFSPERRSLAIDGKTILLGAVDGSVLAELVANPARVMSRERLLAASHAHRTAPLNRAIDTAVLRLRKLIEPDASAPRFIRSVRSRGYVYLPQAMQSQRFVPHPH